MNSEGELTGFYGNRLLITSSRVLSLKKKKIKKKECVLYDMNFKCR